MYHLLIYICSLTIYMKKIRRKDDKRVNIDLASSLLTKIRKLARLEGTTAKPYMENALAELVFNKEEEGVI